jgi:predicted lipoprotein with Yx(FWY)xxD motif
MRLRVWLVVASFSFLAACGGRPDPRAVEPTATSETPSATATPSAADESPEPTNSEPPAADGTKIVVGDSDFGDMLYDETGQAIYLFDVETTTKPACIDDCAEAWPPVFTDGEPVGGDGVDPALLGTTKRADGRLQVTYNDHPLYFYAHEGKHEVLCHDVFLNGGNWYVVQPNGDAAPPG